MKNCWFWMNVLKTQHNFSLICRFLFLFVLMEFLQSVSENVCVNYFLFNSVNMCRNYYLEHDSWFSFSFFWQIFGAFWFDHLENKAFESSTNFGNKSSKVSIESFWDILDESSILKAQIKKALPKKLENPKSQKFLRTSTGILKLKISIHFNNYKEKR